MKAYLSRTGKGNTTFFDQVDAEADVLAARIRKGCTTMADPEPLEIFDEVYAEPTPLIAHERAEFAAYLASFEGVS